MKDKPSQLANAILVLHHHGIHKFIQIKIHVVLKIKLPELQITQLLGARYMFKKTVLATERMNLHIAKLVILIGC